MSLFSMRYIVFPSNAAGWRGEWRGILFYDLALTHS